MTVYALLICTNHIQTNYLQLECGYNVSVKLKNNYLLRISIHKVAQKKHKKVEWMNH
jgi:hypothetical protein